MPHTLLPADLDGWASRSFHHEAFPLAHLVAVRTRSVSVCLPARNEAATIGPIVRTLVGLRRAGLIDQVVVADDSTDGTGDIATTAGADVHHQSALIPELGPVDGKGDAMWRSLSVCDGEVVVFLDADTQDFDRHFVTGLLGPLLTVTSPARFVKGYYRRPLRVGDTVYPTGGGRVTELTARPLLRRYFPALAGVRQPLAGELAADRELLDALPFRVGYGVDAALLIDALRAAGPAALAQVDLGCRQNDHQSLDALHHMACAVGDAILDRAEERLVRGTVERPPMARLRGAHDLVAAS